MISCNIKGVGIDKPSRRLFPSYFIDIGVESGGEKNIVIGDVGDEASWACELSRAGTSSRHLEEGALRAEIGRASCRERV